MLQSINKLIELLKLKNDFTTFLMRMALLYAVYALCRVGFWAYNSSLFDSVSIFYINIPFILLSLIPLRGRSNAVYQKCIYLFFIVINALALLINFADIFYYEFKMARIASDDLHYTSQGNAANLLLSFVKDYWYGFILYALLIVLFAYVYKKIPYYATNIKGKVAYYLTSSLLLVVSLLSAIVLIRGGNISSATYPIAMSDATLYVKNPSHSSLILSNPFCLIRTLNSKVTYEKPYSPEQLNTIFTPTQSVDISIQRDFKIDTTTNIVLIILESFGSAHIGALNGLDTHYTPFIDSLSSEGLLFTNAYHNGIRSIDALPALWGSTPTFRTQFLSLPQSVAPTETLPAILRKRGYTTSFMHGAVKESMSFVAYAQASGVDITVSQEEYEQKYGTSDFDGTWGIWDHKFIDFAADNIIEMKEPFFATLFSLSSHSPFKLPAQFEGEFKDGTMPIHKPMQYTDYAIKQLFAKLSKEPSYNNTLFIITADHSSATDVDKYTKVPYSFSVPILFYKPNSNIKGVYDEVASHIDIMPTILGMMGYTEPFFAFGADLFDANRDENFTVNYFGGAFNIITSDTTYLYNEREVIATIPTGDAQHNDHAKSTKAAKALVQQYYTHIKDRDYLPSKE